MVYGALVGIVSAQILGALWYSPLVLGNAWMRAAFPGKTETEIRAVNNGSKAMYIALVTYSVLCILINFALGALLRSGSCVDAAVRGVLISIVVTLMDFVHCAFSARSLVVFVIDHAFDTCVIILMCVCIATIG
ncbi:uncharacterized protein LOC125654932 [Ostrea edulis]|uniref:uncharacterized protein LOC125654932 n=1 Tax=Ostrea edulis TaxID=37623 RepID=UPI0020945FA3|nr:uncharacterized protein LOC125654932 [Ostrea edulis]